MKPAPIYHPEARRLLAYATGNADLPLRLMMEAHLPFCSACTWQVARLSAPGGRLLEVWPEQPPPPDLLERIWVQVARRQPQTAEGVPLPTALLADLPPPRTWRWRSPLSGGCRVVRLLSDEAGGSALYLSHLPPGGRFPWHGHRGDEDSLVLAGGVRVGGRLLEAGDWSRTPPGVEHEERADEREGCWALSRQEGRGVRLAGWRGALQWVLERWL
jgi:putative transcriptional regulator